MEHSLQVSLKNLVTAQMSNDEKDFIEQNMSQQGSIIDLLRRGSGNSTSEIGDLAEARIRASPEQVKSLKSMEQGKQEVDYFMQTSQSQLIIEDPHLKKIHSETIQTREYFGKNGIDIIEELE